MVTALAKHFGVFVLRTPLFVPAEIEILQAELRKSHPDCQTFAQNVLFNEALWLASQRLHGLVQAQQLEKYPDAILALERYLLRMSQRATPFGISAGICAGVLGDKAVVTPPDRSNARRYVRLDAGCALWLKAHILHTPALRRLLTWSWNDARCILGQAELFIAGPDEEQPHRQQHSFMPDNSLVGNLRERVEGRFQADTVMTAIRDVLCCNPDEAEQVFDYLTRQGLAIPEITRLSRNHDVLNALNDAYDGKDDDALPFINSLNDVSQQLTSVNRTLEQPVLAGYQHIKQHLAGLVPAAALKNPVHVDLITPCPTIAPSTDQASRLVNDVLKIMRFSASAGDVLENFIGRFVTRYGSKEVPLLLALDKDLGVGYGFTCYGKEDLLQDASFIYRANTSCPEVVVDTLNQYVIETLLMKGRDVQDLVLPERLFNANVKRVYPQGDTLAAVGTLLETESESGDFSFLLRQLKGPSAVTWLGRFCEADEHIANIAATLAEDEQHSLGDKGIVADVIYAAQGRDANVTQHSPVRKYEIEYFLRSELQGDRAITLGDIVISIRDGEVILRSVTLNKRIFPRLSCAHNTRRLHHPPIYQFFGDVFMQAGYYTLPDFSAALKMTKKLPRIRFGSLVLQPAVWWIGENDRETIQREAVVSGIIPAINRLRKQRSLPANISVGEGDHLLEISLDDPLHAKIFYEFIVTDKISTIREALSSFGSDASNERGHHEMFIPFKILGEQVKNKKASFIRLPESLVEQLAHDTTKKTQDGIISFPNTCSVEQISQHANQWVFTSVWCGRGLVDAILTKYILPWAVSAETEGYLDQWFYVRYDDPRAHIRLRFKGDKSQIRERLHSELQRINDVFAGQLSFSYECYEPESDRYGGLAGLQFAEDIFCLDSWSAANFLAKPGATNHDELMTEYCLNSMDSLLSVLGLKIEEKYLVMNEICRKYYAEFDVSGQRKNSLDKNYRRILTRSTVLKELVQHGASGVYEECIDIRNKKIGVLLSNAVKARQEWLQHADIVTFIPAYFHMCLNRLFSDNRRLKEMMIGDLLRRSYESHLARKYPQKKKRVFL
ncbi:lantibiotic dehydratase [Pseudomonas syringae]|uniref:lantibiotic dehydratase n=1 Tax=Pseudomonas syringae TaxID=317 RepID=UPI000CDB301A|nr:lantibiotic dehydratase [Pseudomonas syringae]POP70115.1 hypothetical protein CXB35_10685 [Pseudomonas syringae]